MKFVKAADNKQRSGPHRRVEKILDKQLGLSNYLSEQPFPPYTVDIYFPEWHVAIEVDGPLHSDKKDKIRDQYLETFYGLKIMRIDVAVWHSDIAIRTEILEWLEWNCEDVDARKHLWSTRH